MTTPAQQTKALVHLRMQTGNIVGGTQLVSFCGVRELETCQSSRRITKNMKHVTCAACIVRVRGQWRREKKAEE